MSKIAISAPILFAVVSLGCGRAFAMGGGGDLSPEQSPYALLAPITQEAPAMVDGRATYTNGGPSFAPDETSPASRRFERRKETQRRVLARPVRSRRFD